MIQQRNGNALFFFSRFIWERAWCASVRWFIPWIMAGKRSEAHFPRWLMAGGRQREGGREGASSLPHYSKANHHHPWGRGEKASLRHLTDEWTLRDVTLGDTQQSSYTRAILGEKYFRITESFMCGTESSTVAPFLKTLLRNKNSFLCNFFYFAVSKLTIYVSLSHDVYGKAYSFMVQVTIEH